MSNDRFKFRRAIKCRKCGEVSFINGSLQESFRFVDESEGKCECCGTYCTDIIGPFEQYTGKNDIHANPIFEGDEIESDDAHGVVKFGEGTYDSGCYNFTGFYICTMTGEHYEDYWEVNKNLKCEIVGNIHNAREVEK